MTLSIFEQVTDYVTEAATRPLEQYQDRPRFLGLLLSYIGRCQEFEDAIWDVLIKRMVDNAVDLQLDVIGKIVGEKRLAQSDALYRVYITARIRLNRSDGHPDDAIEVLQLVDSALFFYTEFYPGVVYVEYTEAASTDPLTLRRLAELAVAAGVRVYLVTATDEIGFLFGDDTPGGQVDALHGFGNDVGTTGGSLAGIW